MVKFVSNGQVVTVLGEQDYAIYKETAIPYIGNEEAEEPGLQIFSEVGMIADEVENEDSVVQIGTFGLGYAPTQREVQEMKRLVRGKRGDRLYRTPMKFPDIRETFPKPAYIQQPEVAELSESFGHRCNLEETPSTSTTEVLNNWFSVTKIRASPLLE